MRTISQGQYVAPIHAAESYIGSRYTIGDGYSANPADYWAEPDFRHIGPIIGPITLRTVTGRTVTTTRILKTDGTVGDLRRLARAAERLVVR